MAHARLALATGAAASAVLGAAAIAGCAGAAGGSARGAADAQPAAAFYDWRGLLPVPFGTLHKDMPLALTEVLIFHDTAGDRGHEDGDCYSPRGVSPPALLGQTPDAWLLCFDHDRLRRIHASIGVPAADAPALLAAACKQWRRGAPVEPGAADNCEGHDGTIDFSAHLSAAEAADAPGADAPGAETSGAATPEITTLSLTLHDHPP